MNNQINAQQIYNLMKKQGVTQEEIESLSNYDANLHLITKGIWTQNIIEVNN